MVKFGFQQSKPSPSAARPPALDVCQLDVGYPSKRYAISNISFRVEAGERVAVIGPNGAGKSTLFKAIVGFLPFTRGHISIYGNDCYSSHSHVGYVPQQSEIDWSFPVSVFDVVMMGRSRHIGWLRRPSKKDRAIVRDILARFSLSDLANRQIGELSGGQRRRVFIARALAQDTPVLLMDEPFIGIDHRAEHEIMETLDILTRQGITILLSTHHLEKAAQHFDKILILNGSLLAFGEPAAVLTPEKLTSAFGPTLPIFRHQGELLLFSQHHRSASHEHH